jgi:hypothetical protein
MGVNVGQAQIKQEQEQEQEKSAHPLLGEGLPEAVKEAVE